jgi:hypothetical protein
MISRVVWILPVVASIGPVIVGAGPTVDIDRSSYVWSEVCQECHSEIYQAWTKTKHKKALDRLSRLQRDKECVRCHLTGSETILRQGDNELNAGVQCEACHGPALSHVTAASADLLTLTEPLTLPDEKTCVQCHCSESPRYQWFEFRSMKQFIHPVKEKPNN